MRETTASERAGAGDLRQALAAVAGPEPAWLAQAREQAFDLYWKLDPPDRTTHRWRYTDPGELYPAETLAPAPALGDAGAAPTAETVAAEVLIGPAGGEIRLSEEARRAGVIAGDLGAAAASREAVAAWLGQLVRPGETPFAALNAALWSSGLYLEIPPGTVLERPLLLSQAWGAGGVSLPRVLLVVGEGASATVIDEARSAGGGQPLFHRVFEAILADGAQLRVTGFQDAPEKARGTSLTRFRLHRQAQLTVTQAVFGGGLIKADLAAELAGAGARAEIQAVVFGVGRQRFDHHVILDHRAPDTSSHLGIRVALKDQARSACTGMLRIAPEAVRTQAYQENKNILLSASASAVSIPELEILTDEVQASHGATVGPVDEDQLYYLESRGLARPEAEAMVVSGFFEPLVAGIGEEALRERIREVVETRLAR